jgi:hypothetical protein
MASPVMLPRVALVRTDVSEELSVTLSVGLRICELGTISISWERVLVASYC